MPEPLVYLVPSLDVNWVNFAPMREHRGFVADPPPVSQCADELAQVVEAMNDYLEGHYVFAVHTGTYNRREFYQGTFLESYAKAVAAGAELAIHPHEEIRAKGTGHITREHMAALVRDRQADLATAGLKATAYKGGHFCFPPYMVEILDAAGLHADLSAAPGFSEPLCDADWIGSPLNGGYLDMEDPKRFGSSRVFELPLGNDGTGLGSDDDHTLYVEKSSEESLKRVWDAIVARAAREDRPQFVHLLWHNSSIAIPKWYDLLRRLIDHARANGGRVSAPREARAAFDRLPAVATA